MGEYVIKLRGAMEAQETALTAELVSHHLASILGIGIPQAAVLTVTKEFAESIPAGTVGDNFRKSIGENFGSHYLSPSFTTWPTNAPVPANLVQAATDLFAFDIFLNNPDRLWHRPNFLCNGEEIIAIDHDMAFSFTYEIFPKKTLGDYCTAAAMPFLTNHALYTALKKRPIDLNRLEGASATIDAAAIKLIDSDIPKAWRNAKTPLILEYIKAVATRKPPFTRIAHEVLS